MKQIIDGLIYDTEKAVKVAIFIGNEILYKTDKGNYFAASEGSQGWPSRPLGVSPYLKPLTREQAILWLMNRNGVGALNSEFGVGVEDA